MLRSVLAALCVPFFLGGCLAYPLGRGYVVSDDPSSLYAPHQKDGRFFCPWHEFQPSVRRVRVRILAIGGAFEVP